MDARLSIHPEENRRKFLFSGIPANLEKSLVQKIESLHGKLLNPVKDTFPISCTHVIALEFQTTEKILGALAGGKWLLSAKYILDSYKEGRWLKEEGYELTDFNELATYHRRKRMLKGYGLYEGWKILVLLNPSVSRKFKRILVAGGAEIALKDDTSIIDFVVTNKEMLDHAKAIVDSVIPLVDVSFIRSTLILRHDPVDLKTFDLRHDPKLETSYISAGRTTSVASEKSRSLHGGKKLSEIQAVNSPLGKKGKLHCRFKQTSLTQFIKKEFDQVKKPSSGYSICDKRSALGKKDLSGKINNVSKSSHSNNTLSSASVVYDVEDNRDNSQNGDRLKRSDTNQNERTERTALEDRTLSNIPVVYKVNDDIQNQDELNRNHINDIQPIEKKTSEDITSVNALSVTKKVNGNLQNQYGEKSNCMSEIQTKKCVSKDVTPVSTSSGVPSVESNTHNVVLKEFHICMGEKINAMREPNLFGKSPLPNCDCINSYSKNPPELLKRWSLKCGKITSEPTEKCVMANPLRFIRKKSLDSVSEQVLQRKEAVSPNSQIYTITKEHFFKVIVQFLRTRNYLNDICSKNSLCIPRGIENFPNLKCETLDADIDSQQVLDAPNYQQYSHEHRELTSRELHFYTCCTEVDDTVNEKELLVNAMETLLLQVSSYVYPPPSILGSLLKDFVIETQFSVVHSRALRVAYMLLSLHPPASTKMQTYYLRALKHAMKPNDFGSYIPWKFVQHVIQLAACMESDEASCFNQNTEEEEVLDKATKALHLLEFIVLLLTEDVRHSTYGEGVQDLLTWQIFCGTSENCHVLKSPVKELIKLWMSQQTTTTALQWHLSQLVSLVLEALWKFSGQPLLPVDTLPTSLAAVQKEIRISFKGLRSQEHSELIWSLPTPWARAVVSFIIVQENAQCLNRISLPYCDIKITNSDRESERENSMELFLTLANCYLENSCNRYVGLTIKKFMSELLKNAEMRKRKKDGVFTLSLTKNYCQTSKGEETKATKECMPQYLNLLEKECLQELNEFEKAAVAKIISCIRQDKDVSSKWSRYGLSPGEKIDTRQFFKTLCL
ncbi:uncharacterized protein LOC127004333 isoform X2 [Eriocheir sinensis]|nr:uncharacterized protein LOC127004333 isoform X2 [Eriocheir sinensis]